MYTVALETSRYLNLEIWPDSFYFTHVGFRNKWGGFHLSYPPFQTGLFKLSLKKTTTSYWKIEGKPFLETSFSPFFFKFSLHFLESPQRTSDWPSWSPRYGDPQTPNRLKIYGLNMIWETLTSWGKTWQDHKSIQITLPS